MNMRCCDCEFKNRCDETEKVLTSFVKCYKRDRLLKEQKTQTNADKIRSMTDEELADFLDKCEGKGYQDSSITPINEDGYHMDMLDWLKQPAKED